MNKRILYSPEVRERAVRLVLSNEHEHGSRWSAIQSVASKIGCTPETLRTWINKMEVNSGLTGYQQRLCRPHESPRARKPRAETRQ